MKNEKRIVHIVNGMDVGGVEVGVLSLLMNSSDFYHIVTVTPTGDKIKQSLPETCQKRLHICNGYIDAFKTVKSISPDVLVTSLWRAHIIGVLCQLAFTNIKRIHFAHVAAFGHIVNNFVTRISLRCCSEIFSDSTDTSNWLVKNFCGIRNKKIINVPMNVCFREKVESINVSKFVELKFIFVGRYCRQKNLQFAIEFVEKLIEKGLSVKFDLFGRDDGTLNELKHYVKTRSLEGFISFNGELHPTIVENTMSQYHYYLQPSLAEGMAISVFQSLRAGLCPVVNPVGEISKYTKHKKNSFHIDVKDFEASVSDFYSFYNNGFKLTEPGVIYNESDYPDFYSSFFYHCRSY
ncbi:glycosyltransferase [Shewanella indica]|uniref:glycosyltransferase n=1 Tax=Shewanella indica TaxID=768528 RepID=UPI000C3239F6|nr:glycosyltransferase [Shewanella indica]GHB22057.1 hypothetical protein GCM10007107_38230 [Shewanella indica]